jgi:hypothetical protein
MSRVVKRLALHAVKANRENVNNALHTNSDHGRTEHAGPVATQGWGRSWVGTMATIAKAPWRVGATEKTVSGRNWRHGFGFSIQDSRGLTFLSISYETEKEAKQAEVAIRKALEEAIDISRGWRFGLRSP